LFFFFVMAGPLYRVLTCRQAVRGTNNINKRSKQLLRRIFLLAMLAVPAAAQAIDITAPKIALETVPFDIVVSDADAGATVSLTVDGTATNGVADADGVVTFSDLVVPDRPPYP
jgi:hypothetical protein